MFDVMAIGEVLIDFACLSTDQDNYPTMAAHPGGAPANFLAALQKYGFQTGMIAKVGDDAFGRMLVGTLEKAGIGTQALQICKEAFTTLAFVTFDDSGDREFSFSRKPGADTLLSPADIPTDLLDQTRALHFGTVSMTDEPSRSATKFAVEYAKKAGKTVTYDPNLRVPLWADLADAKEQMLWGLRQADVVKISDNEVDFLFGEISYEDAAEKMMTEFGSKLVFITLGKDGCLYANRNGMGRVPGLKGLKTIDTTGAGDIFGGSAVSRLLKTGKAPEDLTAADMEAISRYACTAAGISTTRPGGIFSVPAEEEVLATMV